MAPTAASGRGEARRERILDATLVLLRKQGPGGVSHRAVARAADVPLAATTYYFESKDELLEEALNRLAREEIERLERIAEDFRGASVEPAEFAAAAAAALADALAAERKGMPAKFAIYAEAALNPSLRPAVERWVSAFRALAESVLAESGADDPAGAAELLVGAIDGVMLHTLATGAKPQLRERLERLLHALVASR